MLLSYYGPLKESIMGTISKKIHVPEEFVLLGCIVIMFIIMLTSLQDFILKVLGIGYPAFTTCLILEAHREKPDDAEKTKAANGLLVLWASLGVFFMMDTLFGMFLSFFMIYKILRAVLVIWMVYPDSHLPEYIYGHILSPLLKKYKVQILEMVENLKKTASSTMNEIAEEASLLMKEGTEKVKDVVTKKVTEVVNERE